MKHSGRNIYNQNVTKGIVNMNSSQCMVEIVARRKAATRQRIENTPEFKTHKEGRELAQDYDVIKKSIISDLRESTKQTVQNVLEFIKEELGIINNARKTNGYKQLYVSSEQIEEIINDCLPILKELRRLSDNQEINSVNVNFLTSYELLFVELIHLDTRFALYSPLAALKRSGIVEKLEFATQEHQDQINLLKEKLEEDEHLDYVSTTEIIEPEIKDERDEKVQAMTDFIDEEEFKSKYHMVGATETLCSNVYLFIVKQLNLQNIDEKTLKYTDIKNTFELCSSALSALKDACSRKDLNEVSGWEEFDPYTELFNRLMELNIKFAFFAPKKSLNRLDIDFKRLSEKERNIMLKVLIDNGLWDDNEFYENYKDIFYENINETI